MASPALFGLGGLASGLAQGWADARARKAERQILQHRTTLELLAGISANENTRPEVRQRAMQTMLEAAQHDPTKKPYKLDVSSLLSAPEGYEQAGTPANTQPMLRELLAHPDIPVSPEAGAAARGTPASPPWTPFYTPEEKSQLAAQGEAARTKAVTLAQLKARKEALEGLSADEQAIMLGRPMVSRLQAKAIVNPADPQGAPIWVGYDPVHNRFVHPDTGEEIANAQAYHPPRKETAWDVELKAGRAAGIPDADIVKQWNTRNSSTSGIRLVRQPDDSIVAVPVTTTTTTQRGSQAAPSGAPAGAGKPAGAKQEPRVVGGKIPPAVTKQFDAMQEAISNYNMMKRSIDAINGIDANGNRVAPAPPGAHDMMILSRHLAMTLAAVKGVRLGRDLIEHHLKARSTPESVKVMLRKFMAGEQLSPSQRAEFLRLAKDRMEEEQRKYDAVRAMYRPVNTGSVDLSKPLPKLEFSISAWKKANPNGDVEAAKKEATRLKYTIVD